MQAYSKMSGTDRVQTIGRIYSLPENVYNDNKKKKSKEKKLSLERAIIIKDIYNLSMSKQRKQ